MTELPGKPGRFPGGGRAGHGGDGVRLSWYAQSPCRVTPAHRGDAKSVRVCPGTSRTGARGKDLQEANEAIRVHATAHAARAMPNRCCCCPPCRARRRTCRVHRAADLANGTTDGVPEAGRARWPRRPRQILPDKRRHRHGEVPEGPTRCGGAAQQRWQGSRVLFRAGQGQTFLLLLLGKAE